MLPNWNERLWASDYNGITVAKDIDIEEGFKVYIHGMPDDGCRVRIGIFTYVHQLRNLAKAIGVEYPIKLEEKSRVENKESSNKKYPYYWDEFGNKKAL